VVAVAAMRSTGSAASRALTANQTRESGDAQASHRISCSLIFVLLTSPVRLQSVVNVESIQPFRAQLGSPVDTHVSA
jgi:hypothetical protein